LRSQCPPHSTAALPGWSGRSPRPYILPLDTLADHGKGGRLSGPGHAIETDDLLLAAEDPIGGIELRWIQVPVALNGQGPGTDPHQSRASKIDPVPVLHPGDRLALHPDHRDGRIPLPCRLEAVPHGTELALRHSPIKFLPHLASTGLTHAAAHRCPKDGSFILAADHLKTYIFESRVPLENLGATIKLH